MVKSSKKEGWKEKIEALKLAVKWTYQSSKFLTIAILVFIILGSLITIVEPYIFKLILDHLLKDQVPTSTTIVFGIISLLAVYGVAKALQNIFWDVSNLIRMAHNPRIERYVMSHLMKEVSSLDLVYFEDPEYYNTLTKATSNLWRIIEIFWKYTFLAAEAVSVIVIMVALFAYDWRLVAIVVFGAIPSILLVLKTAEVQWSAFSESSPLFRQTYYYRSLLTEQPEAIKEIKIFRLRDFFLKKFRDLMNIFIKTNDHATLSQLKWYIIIGVIEGGLSVFAAWLTITSFTEGEITIGTLTFLWALLFQFAAHVRWVVRMIGEMNTHAVFLTSSVKMSRFKPTITEPTTPKKFPKNSQRGIEFKNVSFTYRNSKKTALKNINFIIKPAESIAFVGENGSGKTTLIKLLCRLYDVSGGEILINGINVKDYSLQDLSDNIGVIFQDFIKYEALVEENISYGNITVAKSKEKVMEAAKNSGAWDFIKELEKKLKTPLGKRFKEEGIELSGGQWQKIALARAFFKDAPILILDEPTAAVDAKAEYELFKKFKELSKNKTTILISHRFSTVRMADRIIVIDKGQIVEQGSHQELLAKNGVYATLFRLQAKGYE